jgi:hypothetical protein
MIVLLGDIYSLCKLDILSILGLIFEAGQHSPSHFLMRESQLTSLVVFAAHVLNEVQILT